MTENKQFDIQFDGVQYFCVVDVPNERTIARLDTRFDALAWLEMYQMLHKENVNLENQMHLEKGNGDYYKQLFEEKCDEIEKLEEQLRNLRRLANELYMEGSE